MLSTTLGLMKRHVRTFMTTRSTRTKLLSPQRSFTTESLGNKAGGIGLHNVQDQIISTAKDTSALYQHTSEPRTCTIIGAPMTHGQPYVGVDHGPTLLRRAGLLEKLAALSWRVEDLADLDFKGLALEGSDTEQFPGKAKNHRQVGAGNKLLATTVEDSLRKGCFPLILGGDHSIGIGSLAGILKAKPTTGVLWIDAHADLNVPTISGSGNMHGMPVGLMMKGGASEGQTLPSSLDWLRHYPQLHPNQIVFVGLRDVDLEERKLIHRLGISAYTMTEIDRYGIGQTMDMALNDLTQFDPTRPLHLSFDIDAIDPVLAPATGTKVRGGLTFREALYVCEAVAATGQLASAEIVELNPNLSNEQGADDTVELGMQILTSLLGKSII